MVSEVVFEKEENAPWGFRLTGGPQFNMPITVFEFKLESELSEKLKRINSVQTIFCHCVDGKVEEGGRAFKAGIRCGDVLVRINGMDASQLSLEDAHKMISEAGNNVSLSISNDDQELLENEELARAKALSLVDEDTDTETSHDILKSEDSIDILTDTQKSEASVSEVQITESIVETSENISKESISDAQVTDSVAATSENISKDSLEETPDSNMSSTSKHVEKEFDEEEQRIDVNSLPLRPPMPAPVPEKPQRKCWHPVMLDTSPPPIIEESTGTEEYPHKKTIRNLRKAIDEHKVKPTPEALIFFLCNKFAVSEERKNKITV